MYKKILLLSCIFLSGCLATLRDPGFRQLNITVVKNEICAQFPELQRGEQAIGVLIKRYYEEQNKWLEVARINFPEPYTEKQIGECMILPDYKFISGNRYSLGLIKHYNESLKLQLRYSNQFFYEENYNRITLTR